MNESQRAKRLLELEDWLQGPFVRELFRYVDSQIAYAEATPILSVKTNDLPTAQARALGNLEALMNVRAIGETGSPAFEDCFFPEEGAE